MQQLKKDVLRGLVTRLVVLSIIIFFPAGTFIYWQGLAYLYLSTLCDSLIMLQLWKRDPRLLRKRISGGWRAEKETAQKAIVFILSYGSLAVVIFSALDHRLKWSSAPYWAAIMGDILIIGGFYIIFSVFRANAFASPTIELMKDQKLVTGGPYGIIRHPMYVGSLLILLGTPLALGSYAALLLALTAIPLFAWRIVEEEKFLRKNLYGYKEYQSQTHWRLVPWIF